MIIKNHPAGGIIFAHMLSVFIAFGAFAQNAESAAPPKYALVIGNGVYTNLSRLANPVNDANDVTLALISLGFTVDKVLNGSLEQMENAVTRLRDRLSESSDAYGFFFYAGHGVQSGGENYLIPISSNIPSESYLRERALSVQIILDDLNEAGNSLNVVVLDACRDNPFGWSRGGNSRGLAYVTRQPADSIVVYATSAGQTASDGDGGRNGLFTSQLLPNLTTPGLEVTEVFKRTGADVSRASANRQIPAIYSQFFGTAFLGGGSGSVLPDKQRPLTPIKQGNNNKQEDKSAKLWTVGASLGSTFSSPWLVGTVRGTLAPWRNQFFELGMDAGFVSGISDANNYYSLSPFMHYAYYLPFEKTGGLYAGAGGSYSHTGISRFGEHKSQNIFAFDVTGGFRFNIGIGIFYTLRTNFSSISNTLSVGYSFRFR